MQFDHTTAYFISGILYIFIPLMIWWLLSGHKSELTVWWCSGGVILGLATLWVPLTSMAQQPLIGAVTAFLFFVGIHLKIRTLWSILAIPYVRSHWIAALAVYVVIAMVLSAQQSRLYSHVFTVLTHGVLYGYLAWLAWNIYKRLGHRSSLGIFASYVAVVLVLLTLPVSGLLGHEDAWKTGLPFAVLLLMGVLIIFVNHMAFMGLLLEGRLGARAPRSLSADEPHPSTVIERLFWTAERERVLAGMARRLVHEINQPLTSLSSTVSLMRRAIHDDRWADIHVSDLVDRMGKNLTQASHVVNQIRPVAKGAALDIRPLELLALAREAIDLLGIPDEQVRIEASRGAHQDVRVSGSRVELVQVLVNLLRNAVQAAEGQARTPVLKLGLQVDQGLACIVVSDNGPGFTQETLAKLGREIFSTKAEGMGLGLWISKDIIENHAGRLIFENRGDAPGAQVKVCLPLAAKG